MSTKQSIIRDASSDQSSPGSSYSGRVSVRKRFIFETLIVSPLVIATMLSEIHSFPIYFGFPRRTKICFDIGPSTPDFLCVTLTRDTLVVVAASLRRKTVLVHWNLTSEPWGIDLLPLDLSAAHRAGTHAKTCLSTPSRLVVEVSNENRACSSVQLSADVRM